MFSRAPSILTLLFLICVPATLATDNKDNAKRSLVSFLKIKLEDTFEENVSSLTKWLEGFNDKHLGRSEFGKLMLYEDVKPKLQIDSSRGNIKKMGMAMMPLVFHIGAASTWMVLTSIMAVKSVMIGLVLLVFKIAVSSAKVASFFTALKSDHGWSSPHHEHHSHFRSFFNTDW